MTAKALSIITAILAIITVLAGLDLNGVISLIPGGNAALVTYISGGLATLGTILRAIGDLLDDGKVNGSYGKVRMHPVTFLLALGIATIACLTGCKNLTLTASTPWGDVESANGNTTVAVKPVVILREK